MKKIYFLSKEKFTCTDLDLKKFNTIRKENNVLRKKVRELKLKLPFEFMS